MVELHKEGIHLPLVLLLVLHTTRVILGSNTTNNNGLPVGIQDSNNLTTAISHPRRPLTLHLGRLLPGLLPTFSVTVPISKVPTIATHNLGSSTLSVMARRKVYLLG
jgi:hypothetical protein